MKQQQERTQTAPDHFLPTDSRTHTFYVYEAATGHLVHGHRVVVLPYGGDVLEKEQMLKQALEFAVEVTGRDPNSLRVIEVRDDELEPGVAYKVDVESKRMKRLGAADARKE